MNEENLQEQSAAPNPPIFSCRTLLNAQTQQEAAQALAPRYLKFVNYTCFGLCVVMFGLLLWSFFAQGNTFNLVLAVVVLLVAAYQLYSHFRLPQKMLTQWEENMRKKFGTDALHLTTEFYKFSIAQTLDENNDVLVDNYSDLLALVETEHLFLLKKNRSFFYLLAKDGFQNCSAEEFRSFISERIGG